jgi:Cu-Zn family superoxide dismutase
VFLDWTGTPFPYTEAYINANGIVATPDGKYVLVVQYTDGTLFRVRLSDKKVTQVDLGGYRLISGDGMVLSGKSDLYVVRPFGSLVAKLRLNAGYDRARLVSETTNPDFHGPTTAAIAGDRLLVVNSQFSGPPSSPPWTVTSIALP